VAALKLFSYREGWRVSRGQWREVNIKASGGSVKYVFSQRFFSQRKMNPQMDTDDFHFTGVHLCASAGSFDGYRLTE
jgi:hypothetical protein